MNDETSEMIAEKFKGAVAALDDKTALINGLVDIKQKDMKEIANTAKQPVSVEMHGDGEIKTLSDGTRYQVTNQGWRKLDITEYPY